jgi:hypothetical protein
MASKKNETHNASDNGNGSNDLEGFQTVAKDYEAAGWWKPKEGEKLHGIIRDVRIRETDEGKPQLVYVLETKAVCTIKPIGEDEAEAAPVGCFVLFSETAGMIPLRAWAEKYSAFEAVIVCKKKVKLAGGRKTMWTLDIGAKAGTPRPVPLNLEAMSNRVANAKMGDYMGDKDKSGPNASDDIPF